MNKAADQLVEKLAAIRAAGERVGFDVEGYPQTGVTDSSFATSPSEAIWIPFRKADGSPWWSPSDEQRVTQAWRGVLEDPAVPKVCHNMLYELFVLRYAHGITLRGIGGDTMLLFHEALCEFEKALEVGASLFTRQPYWKHGREAVTEEERARYNCTDSMVTLELEQALLNSDELNGRQLAHYHHRLELLEPTVFQMLHGFRFDHEARQKRVAELWRDIYGLQGELDELAGIDRPTLREVVEAVCNKRKWDDCTDWPQVMEHANKKWREEL